MNAPPLTILLVEDSPDDVFFFRRAVAKSGVTASIHVACDGLAATHCLLHEARFADAMFLDLKLPHMNGFEVLEWMRTHAECPRPPVFILTSSSQPEDQDRAAALGVEIFLTKPPASEQLREVLSQLRRALAAGKCGAS